VNSCFGQIRTSAGPSGSLPASSCSAGQNGTMILTLDIEKRGSGEYWAHLSCGGQTVTDALGPYRSLTDSIVAAAQDIPGEFARFVEPRFGGVSAGTLAVSEAANPTIAASCTERIMRVTAALHDAQGR
jgi:hypothetical protein